MYGMYSVWVYVRPQTKIYCDAAETDNSVVFVKGIKSSLYASAFTCISLYICMYVLTGKSKYTHTQKCKRICSILVLNYLLVTVFGLRQSACDFLCGCASLNASSVPLIHNGYQANLNLVSLCFVKLTLDKNLIKTGNCSRDAV